MIVPKYCLEYLIQQPEITFDGHRFPLVGAMIPYLYMCHRARNGDTAAAELLDKGLTVITDLDGKQYWPVVENVVPSEHPLDNPNTPGMGVI